MLILWLVGIAVAGVAIFRFRNHGNIAEYFRHFDERLIPSTEPDPAGISAIRNAQRVVCTPNGQRRYVSVICSSPHNANTAVIFVPGAGGQAEQFYEQAGLFGPEGELSNAVGVYFSYPGHGANGHGRVAEKDLSFHALVEDVIYMYHFALDQLGDGGKECNRAVIVAHSYGCALVARALSDMPRVHKVLLLAPALPKISTLTRWIFLRMPPCILDIARAIDRADMRTGGAKSASVRRMLGRNGEGVSTRHALRQLAWNRCTPSAVVQALGRQTAGMPDATEFGALLKQSLSQAVILVSHHDRLTPASCGLKISEAAKPIAQCILLEGDIGHQLMMESPSEVNRRIVDIVKHNARAGEC